MTPDRGWPTLVARHIPAVVLAEPWAFFVKSLCIVSGLSTFVGPAPGSIDAALPPALVFLWSATLVGGSAAALYGLVRPNRQRVEITGLIWLGTAAVVYAAAILAAFRLDGLVAAGIVLAFGLAALIRALAVYVTVEIVRRATLREEQG